MWHNSEKKRLKKKRRARSQSALSAPKCTKVHQSALKCTPSALKCTQVHSSPPKCTKCTKCTKPTKCTQVHPKCTQSAPKVQPKVYAPSRVGGIFIFFYSARAFAAAAAFATAAFATALASIMAAVSAILA